jgi:hypothetical protein
VRCPVPTHVGTRSGRDADRSEATDHQPFSEETLMSDHDDTNATAAPQSPVPHPRLRDLDVLVGTWRLVGRDIASGQPITGTVTRRWLPGGFFLVQTTQTDGHPQAGVEYIGYDSAADGLRSMLFSDEGPGPFCPFALEYVWDVTGDELTIWHGYRDSPARFSGAIDRDARTISGAWEWPGGGYEVTVTRTD